jgi:hypothetical protein
VAGGGVAGWRGAIGGRWAGLKEAVARWKERSHRCQQRGRSHRWRGQMWRREGDCDCDEQREEEGSEHLNQLQLSKKRTIASVYYL